MNRTYLIAGVVAAGAAAWMLTGEVISTGAKSAAAPPVKERGTTVTPAPTAVRTLLSVAEPHGREVVVRGRTEARRTVEIKAELPGRVVQVLVAKGSRVKAGDVLVKLAVDDRAAWLAEAEAAARQRQIEYNAAKALAEKGYRAETKLAEATALLDGARAKVKRMEVEIGKLTIRAPFNGIVETRVAELGAFLKDGSPVAMLVDQDPFLVVGQISEKDVAALAVGQPGSAVLIDGRQVQGSIRFIGGTADAATRTFRVELEVPNSDGSLRDGMTADLRFPLESVLAHRLSPALLTLNNKGVVGLRTVNAQRHVEFRQATIVGDGPEGVWIAGLPAEVEVIAVGQEFVREGQSVNPTRIANGAGS